MWRYIFLLVFLIFSCGSEELEPDPRSLGYLFYPLQVGDFVEYEVEETTYRLETPNLVTYQKRTEVVDSFQNQAGEITYILHCFRRASSNLDWEFEQTNSARRTATQGIFIEGNTPLLKLSFPISAGKMWNGNALNTMDEDFFEMDSLFSGYITQAQDTIPETLTVIQEDNQDFIANLITNYEIYGLGIGMVYKEEIDVRYCTDDPCIGQQIIDNGRIFRQSIINYGKN